MRTGDLDNWVAVKGLGFKVQGSVKKSKVIMVWTYGK